MKAVVDAAHAQDHKVAIHSYGPSGVKDAVRAGADSVEHGIDLDDETIADMVERGTVWVPTIDHNRYYVDAKDEFGFAPDSDSAAAGLHREEPRIDAARVQGRREDRHGLRRGLHDVRPEHPRARLVRQGRHDARAGARHRDDDRGRSARTCKIVSARLAPGYFADLVAVEGDPLENIDAVFTGVRVVVKDGKIVIDKR